jgi:6-phosphogluconolactonase (cycloisomerase 2 family)
VVASGAAGELSIHIESRGRFAYVTNSGDNSVAAFGLHPLTGELTPAGTVNPGMDPRSVAMGPTGEYLYATSEDSGTISVYAVDQTTGALTAQGTPLVADFLPGGITIVTIPH